MDKTQIIIFVLLFAVLGFRIYQKYFNKNKQGTDTKSSQGSQPTSSSKDDEYEPYSKK
jgi:hypothetical protein